MENIIEQIKPVLEKLGELTKQGASFSWEVILKQQYVDGFIALFIAFIGFIGIMVGCMLIRFGLKKENEDMWITGILVGVVGLIMFSIATVYAIYNLANPEYQAIEEIFRLVK